MSGGCLVILYEASASFSTKLSQRGCLLLTLEQTSAISNLIWFRLKRAVQASLPLHTILIVLKDKHKARCWRSLHHKVKRKIGVVLIMFGLCRLFFGSSTSVTPLKAATTSFYWGGLS